MRGPLVAAAILLALSPSAVFAKPVAWTRQLSLGSIVGTVEESGSQQPIASALVRVVGAQASAFTNVNGRFSLVGVAPGPCELEIAAPGYRTLTAVPVIVDADSSFQIAVTLVPEPLTARRVVVTVDRFARSAQDATAFTSVVEREDMDARGDLELAEALENAPGVMRTTRAATFESIELRGMPRGPNEFENTLLLIDGVPQTDSRNSARVVNLPIDDVEAIEIVRGPNSALYGRGAIGGAVNVITAQPTPQHRATARAQYGEFSLRKASFSASGPLEDRAGYYFGGASMGNDGYFADDYPSFDVDETSMFGKLTFTPDERSHLMASLASVTSDNSLPTSTPLVGGRLLSDVDPRFDRFSNLNLPTANFHQEELRLTSVYSRSFGANVSVTNTLAYRDIQYRFEESGDLIGAPFDLAAHTLTMYPYSLHTDEEVYYEEARVALRSVPGDLDDELLIGAAYERTSGFWRGDLIYSSSATLGMPIDFLHAVPPNRGAWRYSPIGGDEYSLGAFGLYLQYRLAPTPRVELTAGGRYDRVRLRNKETLLAEQPEVDAAFGALSPKLSALVRVLEGAGPAGGMDLNAYATFSQAFKPPRGPSALDPAGTDEPFLPEGVVSYEVGVRGALADGTATFAAAYFRMRRDRVGVGKREAASFVPTHAASQRFRGLELEAAWVATPRLTLDANLVLYRNRFGDFVIRAPNGDVDLTGKKLPMVPSRIYNLGVTYEPFDDFGLTASLKRVGNRFVDQQNAARLSAYGLLDASLWWRAGPVTLNVQAHNLLDKRYFTSGDAIQAWYVDLGAPRQLALGLAFSHD